MINWRWVLRMVRATYSEWDRAELRKDLLNDRAALAALILSDLLTHEKELKPEARLALVNVCGDVVKTLTTSWHPALIGAGAQCSRCGFSYWAHKGHIIACPLCALRGQASGPEHAGP